MGGSYSLSYSLRGPEMPLFNNTEQHHSHVRKNFPASGTKGIIIASFTSACQASSLTQPASQKHLAPIEGYDHTEARPFCGIFFSPAGDSGS